MERARNGRSLRQYNRRRRPMSAVSHPIDAVVRKYLRDLKPNQQELARRLRRSQGWVNKYLNGAGKATIDDVLRLVAILVLRMEQPPSLTPEQRRLLQDFAALSPAGRKTVKKFLALLRDGQAALRTKSPARSEQKNAGTSARAPGTR